ncbi:flavodoxin family protein [Pelagibacterium montanilacus]|uniref:flavodoxin family protein n=1 Tax=Pelagibacterium montanilacus TaxID=2185280 RepID=UPI000F8F1BCB|nr:flavodoxin family protein [Pelagibacterium montanilacus]
MRSIVLYYSQSGNTKRVAELLATSMGTMALRYTCPAFDGSPFGGLRQAWSIFSYATPKIILPKEFDGHYDLVVMAGPVWGARPASPLRAILKQKPLLGLKQAIFLTCEGSSARFPGEKALSEACALCAQPPVAAELFKAIDLANDKVGIKVDAFAESLRRATAPDTTAADPTRSTDQTSQASDAAA